MLLGMWVRSTSADEKPTRRLATVRHGQALDGIAARQNLGPCSTIAHWRLPLVTPSSGFLNLVSLVRFQPGAPKAPAYGAFLWCETRTYLPKRQFCRHFADETPSNASAQRSIAEHGWLHRAHGSDLLLRRGVG